MEWATDIISYEPNHWLVVLYLSLACKQLGGGLFL